jgi:predicted secreted protein
VTTRPAPGSARFAAVLAALHLALALCGLLRHEMWRDELQAWMVADRAHSVPQLFANLRYEGNPVL